jgi:hypothetical protein
VVIRKGVHTIECEKANYGPTDACLDVVWRDGVFVPCPATEEPARRVEVEARPDAAAEFLERLQAILAEGGAVTDTPAARNYAPRVFAAKSDTFNVEDFAAALFNLTKAGRVVMRDYQDKHRKTRQRLEVAEVVVDLLDQ